MRSGRFIYAILEVALLRGTFLYVLILYIHFRYFKDELAGNVLEETVALRCKAYAMRIRSTNGVKTKVKCKGIVKSYRDRIKFENYLACIKQTAKIKSQVRSIRTKNNVLKIINQKKTAVSTFDDKRWLTCSIHSVGYGSTLIHLANNYCPYCPNASTFYTDSKYETVVDVSQNK
jgi:hypothetical protein